MRIALAQISSTRDPEENLAEIGPRVREAAGAGARIVVFPEAGMCCFGTALGPVAEPLDGPWASRVRGLAAAAGITVVVGMFTPSGDGRVRNTLLVTGAGVDTHYDKIHMFDAFGFAESDTVAPGTEPVTVDVPEADGPGTDPVRVGLSTCYDVRFPGLYQRLADAGATVQLVPASWGAGAGKREQWELLVRARALDTGSFVVACDQADPTTVGREHGKAPTGIGYSLVAGPRGEIVHSLDAGPGVLVADVDPAVAAEVREQIPVLRNRRL
ncbi:hydrolase [Pseudonocardia sp. EC080610-09]|jgi:predicted amidohydrolase|uniref:carbon-nitrogen hydrolase family protein n=1 Tax=unclassified Pseudonocardia TaxID=2619320 RepID=UPI0006CB31F0|nr:MULTISPECIES: carbon-nitrogen hydrolase family protein [unclassified Pseudonocardia]ALE74961.1 hydrolase [Pseudonocardia sp. EC080625-04]ALL74309.1 hydrolase [Pseudonocardia sp. EC080610-09]ALL81332.1 hydrolase [Pseudonocardia sp. EC080619-01]